MWVSLTPHLPTRFSAGPANSLDADAPRPSRGSRLRVPPLTTPSLDFLGSSHRWKAPLPRCPLAAPNLVRAPSLIGQGAAAMTWTRLTPTGWSSSTRSSRRWVGDLPAENGVRGRPGRVSFGTSASSCSGRQPRPGFGTEWPLGGSPCSIAVPPFLWLSGKGSDST